jgi:chromosome segregation ATPase
MTSAVAGLLGAIDEEQKSLNGIHSRALNEVVSGMFQVKSLLKEVETVANTDLCHQFQSVISNAGEQRGKLELLEKELRECIEQLMSESNEDSKAALRKRVSELKVATNKTTISDLTELNDKRNAGLSALRHVNRELMRLNGDTFASLVDAVAQIDQRVAGSGTKIHQLKSVLVKMKNEIDDLLEQIDEDTGSSPVSP